MSGNTGTPSDKAFDLAQSVTQQVLTLATGLVALTLTFFTMFAPNPSSGSRYVIGTSWAVLAASIVFGILTLGTLAGVANANSPEGVNSTNVQVVSRLQLGLFGLGLILTVVAALIAL